MSKNLDEYDFAQIEAKFLKRWLTPNDLEEELGFSKSNQAKMRMVCNATIPFSKIGKYVRYDRVEINRWLEEHKIR